MLARRAGHLEKHDDLAILWRDIVQVLAREGISQVIYLTVDENFENPFCRSTLTGLWDDLPAVRDPFLTHCCSSYEIMPTGYAFSDDYDDLSESELRFIRGAAEQGFVSGIAIPMRLQGSKRFGGFNLGTPLDRAAFEATVMPRGEEFRAFCLLMHRRIEELSMARPTHHETFRSSLIAPDLPAQFASLSPREREVVYLLAQGISRKETAHICGISVNTVSDYAKSAYAKLGVRNRVQVAKMVFSSAAE